MNAILDRETIIKALRRDTLLKKSLGFHARYITTKWFAIVWGIWMLTLLVTPLPETFMLSQLSLLMTAVFAGIFLAIDSYQNLLNEAQLADRIFNLLEKAPALKIEQKESSAHISHPKFQADCRLETALLLDEMVSSEKETALAVERASRLEQTIETDDKPPPPTLGE